MILTGDVAEDRSLTGRENHTLKSLVREFRITTIASGRPLLKDQEKKEPREKKTRYKKMATALLSEIPLSSQREDIDRALRQLAIDYVAVDLEEKYDCLDPKIFELGRLLENFDIVKADRYDRSHLKDIEIPLFAHAKFGESQWQVKEVEDTNERTYNYTITSRAPPITRQTKKRAKSFTGDYMDAISSALRDGVMGDLFLRTLDSFGNPNFDMYWIPTPGELNIEVEVVDKDPFLVASNLGRHFLVHRWDVEGEEPFEHYLKEFKKK